MPAAETRHNLALRTRRAHYGLGAWGFRLAFDEGFLDEYLGGDIGEFAPLPRLHLFAHGLEVALHSVDTERNAINQRERLRMLRRHRRTRAEDNVSRFEPNE
jgi:hypothetical protein